MDELSNLLIYYLEENFTDEAPETLTERKNIIKSQINRLREIYTSLEQEKLIQQKLMTTRSLLNFVLNGNGATLLTASLQDAKQRNRIGQLIFEAYELTSMVLGNLGLIDPIHYTFTYTSKKGNVFYRASDMKIDPNTDLKFELRNDQTTLVIRLKTAQMRHKIMAAQYGKEDGAQLVANHYRKFIEPFLEGEKRSSTGWRMNAGVAAEAFERHWEQMRHSIQPPNITDQDLGSEGYRWVLYRQSSGSDPYYTGPDTAEAQVKNANASIISNADTVINTIRAVLVMADDQTSPGAIAEIAEKYRQAFQQKENQVLKISADLEEAMGEDVFEEVKTYFAKFAK